MRKKKGARSTGHGARSTEHGARSTEHGARGKQAASSKSTEQTTAREHVLSGCRPAAKGHRIS